MSTPGEPIAFRVTYGDGASIRADVKQQFDRNAFLVRVEPTPDLVPGAVARLEIVLPDGSTLETPGELLNVFAGHGVAMSTRADLADEIRRRVGWKTEPDGAPRMPVHERVRADVDRPVVAPSDEARIEPRDTTGAVATTEGKTQAEKIQMALHGTRDARNAVLRDKNRSLHSFVLKNPQITAEDVAQIARNPQSSVDLLKQIAERKEWFQRSNIALALARNPKSPADVAVRALDHVPAQALREIAKGLGALPHVVQAARKRVIGR